VLYFQRLTPRGGARRRKCLIFNDLLHKVVVKISVRVKPRDPTSLVEPSYILREQRGLALGSIGGNYIEYNFRCALDYVHKLFYILGLVVIV
jgi:hypothetical protein